MFKRSFTLRGMAIGLVMLMFACSEDLENKMGPPDVTQDVAAEIFSDDLISNQYIVVFNKEKTGYTGARFSGPKQASEHVKKQALNIVRSVAPDFSEEQLSRVYSSINGAAIKLTADKIEVLRKDERVAYIEQDRIINLAPPSWVGVDGSDGGGSTGGEIVPPGVQRVNGGIIYTGGNVAWVIDTGVDLDHPDLKVDAGRSVSFITSESTADDGHGHGTHVAGTIAAKKDTEEEKVGGVVGVAAGATVVAVKVLNSNGSGSYSGVIAGVEHVGQNGLVGDVANMSLGGPKSKALNDAVVVASNKGIHFTVAAGNDGAHANKSSPASANGKYIYTISAMDVSNNYTDSDPANDDIWAWFSNYGNPPVDYCAPGVKVYSTYKGGGYTTMSGTSMAAPHAAGVLLLGPAGEGGTVKNDPDNKPDPIIVH